MTATKVLVVGAGPTGLTLAIELARRDIAVRVIDKSPEYFPGSRGKGFAPRSQEVLHGLGVLDQIENSGNHRHFAARIWINGELVADGDYSPPTGPTPGAPYDTGILIPQWRTEEILRGKLAEYGVPVELGAELLEFDQSPDAVVAKLGTGEQIRADYLIGTDGGRSTVRHRVQAGFIGESGPQAMLLGDLRVEGLVPDAWHTWTVPGLGFVALCPFHNWSQWQFQALPLADRNAAGELPPPSATYFQRIFDDIAGVPGVRLSEPSWLSTYRVNVRMVDRFRFDRVFLAGDAAHVHPPTGGLGLNTGIQDANNLGWKLALVLTGKADPGLLDSYGEERLPVAKWTLRSSVDELRELREIMNPAGHVAFRPRGRLHHEQLALGYHWSSLARDLLDRPDGPRAGDRAPDSPCQDTAGRPTRLFEVFRAPWFTLLGFGTATKQALDAVAAKRPDLVTARLLDKSAGPDVDLVDVDGHAHREYTITEPSLILIRPDGHLALTAPAAQGAAVISYLDELGRS
jgi:2-polyprenyl-6-methoxyphenol hydroxylase-like FAD-dependent oxidoreductase